MLQSLQVARVLPHKHPNTSAHQDWESAQTPDWETGSASGCGSAQASYWGGMLMYWHFGEPSAFSELDSAHLTSELVGRCTQVNAIGKPARPKIHLGKAGADGRPGWSRAKRRRRSGLLTGRGGPGP